MSLGKYVSLQEARKKKKLALFIKEHPSAGDETVFDDTLTKMAPKKRSKDDKTSVQE